MTKTLQVLAVTGLVAIAACHRDHAVREPQQNYQTVQEGEASGVTSTIHGPGETAPPITSTNADTTTAFTINPALATSPATPPGTLAGALPNQPYGGVGMPGYVPPTRPAVAPQTTTMQPAPPPRDDTTWRNPPTAPPATTTTAEPEPEQTDTAPPPAQPPTQTQTDAPPPEKTDTEEKTDTTRTTPPPPPPPAAPSW